MLRAILILLLAPSLAHADASTLRLRRVVGPYHVSVFTDASPVAGSVEIGVLVQDAAGRFRGDVPVTIDGAPATEGALHVATLHLLQGQHELIVQIDAFETLLILEVGSEIPAWQELWMWYTWPFGAITGFALVRWLKSRRHSDTSRR